MESASETAKTRTMAKMVIVTTMVVVEVWLVIASIVIQGWGNVVASQQTWRHIESVKRDGRFLFRALAFVDC